MMMMMMMIIRHKKYKLYYDMSKITDRTLQNIRLDIVILNKTIKEECLIDTTISNSHNLHSTNTKKLQKYTALKEGHIRIRQPQTAYIIPPVLSTMGIIPNKLHRSLKLINLHHALYIPKQKAVILNTCHTVRKFLAEQ
jgi:hypothetical protein